MCIEDRSIGWLLQEFVFEVNNIKGMENQVADHFSSLEEAGRLKEAGRPKEDLEIDDAFQNERLGAVSCVMAPYYANITNFW
ncbi:hypothetical protein MTR67_043449 [Solanum verrucosum]|uniref:Uncharacterized protein n=1 Tax=Solanum verrucosum TaxID=315347 RepID=A0AAF0UQA7_SOLVR|nr:hypothetical protein MTR67_043449 [Solanum verrucosum]